MTRVLRSIARNRRQFICRVAIGSVSAVLVLSLHSASALTIPTPVGPVEVPDPPHADPGGSLVSPEELSQTALRPPSIFSAPLPSGSGARALGLSGAFTAVADDATAASWNPGGLTQLERPEVSFVLRYSDETQKHESRSINVGEDSFDNYALNYLSLVYPFRMLDRNFVFSANYQEAYDFEQRFTADFSTAESRTVKDSSESTFSDSTTTHFEDGFIELDVTTHVTTKQKTDVTQLLSSELLTDLEFEQEGVIDALTPAIAVEISPKLSVGAAFNYYSTFAGRDIESRTHARYSGPSKSTSKITDTLDSTGTFTFEGVFNPPIGGPGVPFGPDGGDLEPFSETSTRTVRDDVYIEGEFEEINRFSDIHGYNATFGFLLTVSRHLSLGGSVDLPWTAEAEQKQTVRDKVTTLSSDRSRVLNVQTDEETRRKDVEFDFPMFWALGAVIRVNDRFFTTLDVSQTLWSDFSFKADGEERINPLDGSPHSGNELDDAWAIRGGAEYLLVLKKTEIPFRGGVAWEQRPAIGEPDEFWSFSLGSGISLGKGPSKTIIDFAYILTLGDDVLGSLVPEQDDLATDVVEHQFFLSCIKHF